MAEEEQEGYDNLAVLHGAFGREVINSLFDGETLVVDGIEFVSEYQARSTATRFSIAKPPYLIDKYRQLCEAAHGGRILELGIAEGGSTALLALWAEPATLVSVDLASEPVAGLDEFIAARGLGDRVRPRYGVDQSDGARLREIIAEEFGGEPLDLVIDDASHQYGPTRAAFEAIFPFVAPGGRYVIEDWASDVFMVEVYVKVLRDPTHPEHEKARATFAARAGSGRKGGPARTPLARMGLELALGVAARQGVIDEIEMNRNYVAVQRGPAEVDPATFSLAEVGADRLNLLTPPG